MDSKKYIASGILELYVAGLLSEKENLEVHGYAQKYPEIKAEIEAIEKAVLDISKTASPGMGDKDFNGLNEKLGKTRVLTSDVSERKMHWSSYLGWAATLIFAVGMLWMYVQSEKLKSEMEIVIGNNEALEELILDARDKIANTEAILNQLRDKNVAVVSMGGQASAPSTYAKAYWNTQTRIVFIDAQGLPEPPPGYDYQLWSLILNPLSPTSIGLLEDFSTNDKRIFEFANPNESEAFGITLEPAGGSESPTLEQLYTLGTVVP